MTNSLVIPHLCACVAPKTWGDGDDRVAILRPPPGFTANRHCAVCDGTGELPGAPEVEL
jgi:hypothetical protein